MEPIKFNQNYVEKTIKSETLYEGRIVTLRIETVELPDKKYSKREIVDHARGACCIPVTDDNCLVLVKQYRKAIDNFVLELPAGLVEPNEDPREAAERELQEEIGCKPGKMKYLFEAYASPGFTNEVVSFFLAKDLVEDALPLDDTEFIETVKIPFEELLRMVEDCEISDAKTMIGILYIASHREELK